MTKTEEQIRSEFESWYVPEDDRYREQCLQRNKDGNYIVKGVSGPVDKHRGKCGF